MGRRHTDNHAYLGHAAEARGGNIAANALEEMRTADSQAERLRILHRATIDASEDDRPSRAIGGFAVELVAWLDPCDGDLGMSSSPHTGDAKADPKKNAAGPLAKAPAAQAACTAPSELSPDHHSAGTPPADDFPKAGRFSSRAFEAAFPGQRVVNGRPNRMRHARHCALAMIRSVEAGNIRIAGAWLIALHRATGPAGVSRGSQK